MYEKIEQGLPNLGNTCFLNSAIQSLYSIDQFRKKILQYEPNIQKDDRGLNLILIIQQIFLTILNKKPIIQKKRKLYALINYLKNIKSNYLGRSQQDSSQFLFIILDYIFDEDEQFKAIFNIYYKFSCQRCQQTFKFEQFPISRFSIKCQNSYCNNQLKLILISNPHAIIYKGEPIKNQEIKINNVRNDLKTFFLSAQILYSGNGSFGHYVCKRNLLRQNSLFKTFDDQMVRQCDYYSRFQSKLQIFQLKPNISFQMPIQIQTNQQASHIKQAQGQPIHQQQRNQIIQIQDECQDDCFQNKQNVSTQKKILNKQQQQCGEEIRQTIIRNIKISKFKRKQNLKQRKFQQKIKRFQFEYNDSTLSRLKKQKGQDLNYSQEQQIKNKKIQKQNSKKNKAQKKQKIQRKFLLMTLMILFILMLVLLHDKTL